MTQRVLQFEESVASRIEALLAKCDRIRRGVDVGRPIVFDRRGEQHAREVARRDAKPVDTVMAPPASAVAHASFTDIRRGNVASGEPVTGALLRLSPKGGR